MPPASYTAIPQERQNGQYRGRLSIGTALPLFLSPSSAVQEKYARYAAQAPWFAVISITVPFVSILRIRLFFLNPWKPYAIIVARFGRGRGLLLLFLSFLLFVVFFKLLFFGGDRPSLVFKREDLQRIWHWEIASGHFPSRQEIPEEIQFRLPPENPALPPRWSSRHTHGTYVRTTRGTGAKRAYLDLQSAPASIGFPPRPVPGSIADFDIIMQHCDYERKKFVRDCLEILRVGAGLDNGKRVRRGKLDDWKYIYVEQADGATFETRTSIEDLVHRNLADPDSGLKKHNSRAWEVPPIPLRQPTRYISPSADPSHCDPESSRIFHMFWTGEFTDKPYLAILSFLFTQNTGLHLETYSSDRPCRPQFWMWINPGPAASAPNLNALNDMFKGLKANPWSSPFLHPRFKDVIQFKMWNTTEQLDSTPELKDEWRSKDLFTSEGRSFNVPSTSLLKKPPSPSSINNFTNSDNSKDMSHRAGSKSSETYDRLSVILSDMARFILCHRFGGIYLDADTVFLRDWEEIWGWKGAFAYRWSRLERYNTAVLHLNKNSALGTFLFKTALKNNLDFHPIAIWKYVKEAHLNHLLLRLPDALFDPAWLTTENHIERPPQPFFTNFNHFFETPPTDSAAPQALGFEGFFRGAYSYHYHNFWWKPFDPARNWPDLGPRFAEGEQKARRNLHFAAVKGGQRHKVERENDSDDNNIENDRRDLDWATVLKRVMESYIRGERPNMYGEMLKW